MSTELEFVYSSNRVDGSACPSWSIVGSDVWIAQYFQRGRFTVLVGLREIAHVKTLDDAIEIATREHNEIRGGKAK